MEWQAGYGEPQFKDTLCERCVLGHVVRGQELTPFGRGDLTAVALRYRIVYFFDYGGECLWSDGDERIVKRFRAGAIQRRLPLMAATRRRIEELGAWFDQSLDWASPSDPSPWRQEECDRFNAAAQELLETIRRELGDEFEVIDAQEELREDPDLDARA